MWWLVACGMGLELQPTLEPTQPNLSRPIEAGPAWSASDHCRLGTLQDLVRRFEPDDDGWVRLRTNLDRRRGQDELRILREVNKDFDANYIELKLDGRRWLKTSMILSRSEIMQEVPFPDGANEAQLSIIEDAVFGRICERPDPSLQLLLDDTVRWVTGSPVLPPRYALREAEGWRLYEGNAHESKGRLPVTYPRPLVQAGDLAVVSTGQGVIAEFEGAHAWLFVSRTHAQLRWPSEFSARVEPAGVRVTRHPTTMDEIASPIVTFRAL